VCAHIVAPVVSFISVVSCFRIWGATAGAKQAGYRAAASRPASHGGSPGWALKRLGALPPVILPLWRNEACALGANLPGFQEGRAGWCFSAQGCEEILITRGAHADHALLRARIACRFEGFFAPWPCRLSWGCFGFLLSSNSRCAFI